MDPHPGGGQHPRSPAGADPATGHRQGAAGGRREGTRPLAAPLPGGAGMAPGRVLGAGAAAVRHRLRAPMTGDGGAGPALEIVAGHPSAEELAALTVAMAAVLAAHGDPAAAGPGGRPWRAS